MSTAILSETYRISSELRSQATAGLVSTTVGDHVGIRGAVGSLFRFFCLIRFCFFLVLVSSFLVFCIFVDIEETADQCPRLVLVELL